MTAPTVALPRLAPAPATVALWTFAAVAIGLGAGRAITTTYVPVLLERIADRPGVIGAVMLVNAAAGFAVPLATGLWSDRAGRRTPFIAGGAILAGGGLVAVALGSASSYAVLALAAATVYVGLNAASTAHRALVAERFAADRRAAATGAQEGAMLAGALVGTVVGGALVDASAPMLFALWAVALPLLALPTLAWHRRTAPAAAATPPPGAGHGASLRLLGEVLRRDGARQVLVAQMLWVGSYAALTPFMVLYAEDVLGLTAAAAGVLLAGFGVLTGVGMLLGARRGAGGLRTTLLAGVALLGGGLTTAAGASTVAQAVLPFGAAALGAGLVSSVGFPYFTRFVPDGGAGRYAGAFFSARAVATTGALPVAGLLIEATGSYRALLGMGALGLLALVPLARAERAAPAPAAAASARPVPRRVVAVIPVHRSARVRDVAPAVLEHVERLVLVDDGAPAPVAAIVDELEALPGVEVVRLGANRGKGTAVAAGTARALEAAPDAVVLVDSDGQHPPALIPALVAAAAGADVVIGDRHADARAMPRHRRVANRTSNALLSAVVGRRMRDAQNGMRLLRADALRAVPPPPGGYEAETAHLRALLRTGAELAWVPMPAIYEGEPSGFRPVADSVRVLRAIAGRPGGVPAQEPVREPRRAALLAVTRTWAPLIAAGMLLAWAVAAALPLLAPADEHVFRAVNGLGDGPEWLYQALDPHSRNYALLAAVAAAAVLLASRRIAFAAGALLAMVLAGVLSDLVMELVQLGVDRPRPEEALGAEVARSHDRHWSHIPSFPSGHLMVTSALVAAAATMAPRLRAPLVVYAIAVAVTRVLFGAHFPLDVLVGGVAGWPVGVYATMLVRAAGLLPAGCLPDRAAPVPALEPRTAPT